MAHRAEPAAPILSSNGSSEESAEALGADSMSASHIDHIPHTATSTGFGLPHPPGRGWQEMVGPGTGFTATAFPASWRFRRVPSVCDAGTGRGW
jgi:hypothetical protein